VRLHHNYPNIAGWDSDIEKSDFLKVHPKDQTRKGGKLKKFMIFLYPLFVLNWFLVRDFRDFFTRKTIVRRLGDIPVMEYVKLIFFKLFFVIYMVVIPCLVTPFTVGEVLLSTLIFMIAAGILGLVVLLPPHVNTYSQFPVVSENAEVGHSWLMHQLVTTNDVSLSNWFSRQVMGNFNYHLIHHLFPKVHYVYAQEATQVLRDYCRENGLPYRSLPLMTALAGHFRLILRNQLEDFNLFEEDM
jgi:linoleoyl-CoA desaturase